MCIFQLVLSTNQIALSFVVLIYYNDTIAHLLHTNANKYQITCKLKANPLSARTTNAFPAASIPSPPPAACISKKHHHSQKPSADHGSSSSPA